MTPLCCNYANVNHCRIFFFMQLLHAVIIFGNQSRKLLLFTYGADILDPVTGHVLSRSLREYDNQCIHIISCFGKRGN